MDLASSQRLDALRLGILVGLGLGLPACGPGAVTSATDSSAASTGGATTGGATTGGATTGGATTVGARLVRRGLAEVVAPCAAALLAA